MYFSKCHFFKQNQHRKQVQPYVEIPRGHVGLARRAVNGVLKNS